MDESNAVQESRSFQRRLRSAIINESFWSDECQAIFKENWSSHKPSKTDFFEIFSTPFPICQIQNFISNEKFLAMLNTELALEEHTRQSSETSTSSSIMRMIEVFQRELRAWFAENLNVELRPAATISYKRYRDTSHMICNNGQKDDGKVSFIWYFAKNWTKEDGGVLEFFNTTNDGLPLHIQRSLEPKHNCLIFFEINEHSYHQVSEVKSEKTCWVVEGSFHGMLPHNQQARIHEIESPAEKMSHSDEQLCNWVKEEHLCPPVTNVSLSLLRSCPYKCLNFFLKEIIFDQISSELTSKNIIWRRLGPATSRNYEIAEESSLFGNVAKLYKLFKSVEVFGLFKKYIELVTGESEPVGIVIELQRWAQGYYKNQREKKAEGFILDVFLQIHPKNNGQMHTIDYITYHQNNSVITHVPQASNCLSLMLLESGVSRMPIYITHHLKDVYYTLECSYKL